MISPACFRPRLGIAVAIAATVLSLSPAFAWHRYHAARPHVAFAHAYRHALSSAYARAYPHAGASAYPYWGGWQAAVIARATAEQQNAPGVTNELAPDNMATATGGPVGGVPGFSGP